MKDKKNKEAVIFDMDGVIFDSETLVFQCWNVVAEKYGIKNALFPVLFLVILQVSLEKTGG